MIQYELNACISSQIEKLISVSEISHSIISGQEIRGETDYYTNEVYQNNSHQY